MTSKDIVAWLKKGLGSYLTVLEHPVNEALFKKQEYCGDTEGGFHTEYELDYEALEIEMDKWISQTFGDKNA